MMIKDASVYSAKARWLLVLEATLIFSVGILCYLFISRFHPMLFLNENFFFWFSIFITMVTLITVLKLGRAILSFSISATFMRSKSRLDIKRCSLLYRIFFLRKDLRSPDGWIIVTRGAGASKTKLFLFKP